MGAPFIMCLQVPNNSRWYLSLHEDNKVRFSKVMSLAHICSGDKFQIWGSFSDPIAQALFLILSYVRLVGLYQAGKCVTDHREVQNNLEMLLSIMFLKTEFCGEEKGSFIVPM